MARMPGAVWLGEHSPKTPMLRYDIVCVHTIVGFAPAHAAHLSVKADGDILQSRDTAFRSDANLHGNYRVIAIENEDHGPAFGPWTGSNVPPLTDEQVKSNAEILKWAHGEHGIPLQLCPNSLPASRGLAYHRQGIDGNFGDFRFPGRVSGGEIWTEWVGKACPGDNRIAQLPAILAIATGAPLEDDMQLSDDIYGSKDKKLTVRELYHQLDRFMDRSDARERRMLAAMTGLAEEVAAAVVAEVARNLPPGSSVPEDRLRQIVYNQTQRAINTRLGSLDEA